jgi:hypothetical protein
MTDPCEVHGKCLVMIMWGKHPDGSGEVAVFAAPAHWNGVELTMRFEPPRPTEFLVEEEWLPRIKPVPDDVKEILLHADFYFSVTVGDVDNDDFDPTQFRKTGLKWPTRKEEA